MLVGNVVKDQWKLHHKIGEGAFGEIYAAIPVKVAENPQETPDESPGGNVVAVKVEPFDFSRQVLKLEVSTLRRLQDCPFIPRLYTYGRFRDVHNPGDEYNYMVMELLGENISDLRKVNGGKFNLSTTLRLGIRFIEILQAFHSYGYVHRDVKPSNFIVGLEDKRNSVFIIDFGLSRRYVGADGTNKPQRDFAGFRGTARYASINSHLMRDLGRRDDLWSILYVLIECIKGNLPWRRMKDKDKIGKLKQDWNNPDLVSDLPAEFLTMMDHLQSLSFSDTPDYAYLKGLLLTALTKEGGDESDDFFWVNVAPPEHLTSSVSISAANSQNRTQDLSITSHSVVFESTEGHKENIDKVPGNSPTRFLLRASHADETGTGKLQSVHEKSRPRLGRISVQIDNVKMEPMVDIDEQSIGDSQRLEMVEMEEASGSSRGHQKERSNSPVAVQEERDTPVRDVRIDIDTDTEGGVDSDEGVKEHKGRCCGCVIL
eukprot:TRINITY_DN9471_c0_g1_i1.p1 TRINITY_DN9471_c0_g1~~TRINITY_DN9471_c0_g1_i1.p1  ORF type:complete len:486 (-),score=57.32 TRINITY_DN9471_c0_g1_i1:13-1470(-)